MRFIIIISFFKVDFYIPFYNYKKPVSVNLPIEPCKFITVINQLTILFLCQYRPFNGENIKEKENTSIMKHIIDKIKNT